MFRIVWEDFFSPMNADNYSGSYRVLNVCETVTGGVATYLNVLHSSTSGPIKHHYVLPKSQSNNVSADLDVSLFNDSSRLVSSKFGFRRVCKLFFATLHAVRKEKPEIIFFHSSFTLPVMLLLRLIVVKKKFVYCPHGWAALRYPSGSGKRKLVSLLERSFAKYANVIVNISNFEMSYAKSVGYLGDHRLIVNAVSDVDCSSYQEPIITDGISIDLLFVGRFDHQKGLDILLNAFERVRSSRQDINLHIVGCSVRDNADLLKEQAGEIDGVTLYGWRSPYEISGFYKSVDVMIVPSRWEGFGLVVAESLREGTPVIVSNRGALPEHVEQDKTGYVVNLSENDFYNKIKFLDRQALVDMRPACRAKFEKQYNSDRFAREITDLFKELLE
jgi:glycosyltransferase involved in cell wall biosynthesis